jgi:single-strand DNA-binding protein
MSINPLTQGSINRVQLLGRVSLDPEITYMADGQCVAAFWLITEDPPHPEMEPVPHRATWHRVVAYASLGELCNQYLSAHVQVYVEGQLNTRFRLDQHQQKQLLVEIVAQRVLLLSPADDPASSIYEQDVLARESGIADDNPLSVLPDTIARSDTDDLFARSYVAKYVFRHSTDHHNQSTLIYEERIVLLRVLPDDDIAALVEHEAARYAEDMQCEDTGFRELIDLHTSELISGTAVYSLMRSSQLDVSQYITTFCRANTE